MSDSTSRNSMRAMAKKLVAPLSPCRNDMASLARASSEDFEAGGDDDDEALSEIEEFIRVAVLLLHGDVVLASRHRQRLN